MAGIAAQACGAGLVSAAAVGDDGYESNLRRAGMRPESVSSLELEDLSPERARAPGLNEESPQRSRTSLWPRSDGRILLV